MNSIIGFVVGLLQTTLSLLGFVQQHPEIPPAQQQQVQEVAQQAVTQATQTLNQQNPQNQSNSSELRATPTVGSAPLSVVFSTSALPDCPAGNLSCLNRDNGPEIDFGDGSHTSQSYGESFSHIYKNPGTYSVQEISVTTGKTFAKTMITVKGTQGDISVPGMEKYTDSDFGFSFWYPSGWTVTNLSETGPGMFAGSTDRAGNLLKGRLVVRGDDVEIDIDKIHSDEKKYNVNPGPCGYCGPLTYYFDTSLHSWMKVYPDGPNGAPDATPETVAAAKVPKTADISNNTMGGLHIFSTEQKESAAIVPISARDFLFVEGVTYGARCAGACAADVKGAAQYITRTITATDPSVATPVSPTEQTATIQAEKNAYTGQ